MHAKGDVLDPTIARLTRGRRYRHVVGFEASEMRRVAKDRSYDTDLRTGGYPLLERGWDRDACEEYIARVTGARWIKSACVECPYAL